MSAVDQAARFINGREVYPATQYLLALGNRLVAFLPLPGSRSVTFTADQSEQIHRLFREFSRATSFFPATTHPEVITAFDACGLTPRLHQLRARYEFELEIRLANDILTSAVPQQMLDERMQKEQFWALTPELRTALAGCRRIAFAGSGPLPLTALCIASELGIAVTCIDWDANALELGHKVAKLSPARTLITSQQADLRSIHDMRNYDAIVAAVVVGVDPASGEGHHKREIVSRLQAAAPASNLIFRQAHGLSVLTFPPVLPHWFRTRRVRNIVPERPPGTPYISGVLIAEHLKR